MLLVVSVDSIASHSPLTYVGVADSKHQAQPAKGPGLALNSSWEGSPSLVETFVDGLGRPRCRLVNDDFESTCASSDGALYAGYIKINV